MPGIEKKKIRKDILALRNSLPEAERDRMSENICRRFTALEEVQRCNNLMVFLNFGSEVDTGRIIEWAWQQQKRVLAPLCRPQSREMDVFAIRNFDDLRPGYYGIREPKEEVLTQAVREEIDLVVVPAVAFDRRGYRVGYGGGYYDRFLISLKAFTIGLAFSCQIIPEVPVDQYDQKVRGIVTEKEFIEL